MKNRLMSWTNFFDKIFLINLEKNTDRLIKSLRQFQDYGITAEVFKATYNAYSGAIGLRDSMIRLFTECLEKGYENVLVFEDDFLFLEDINIYMPLCIEQLPKDYSLLYLGAYVPIPFKKVYSKNLLLLSDALTTHAVCYPKKTIEKMLPIFEKHSSANTATTIDELLNNKVNQNRNSYITYPLLVSQFSGKSDIEKKEIDYKKYIEDKYAEQVEKLIKDKKELRIYEFD